MRPFCRKNHVHKIPRLGGGGILGFGPWGGGEFYFYGREDFSEKWQPKIRKAIRVNRFARMLKPLFL